MHRYRNLMVGLGRTNADAELVRYVAMVTELGTAERVGCVHVLPSSAATPRDGDYNRVRADLQASVESSGLHWPASVEVSYDVLYGPLMDQLLTYTAERQVDVLFAGHGVKTPRRGTLARRLAMKAPCSVWMVPVAAPCTLHRILVPIDFSEGAADALRVATSLARLAGHAECLALHVYFNEAVATYEGYDEVIRGQEQQAYRQFIAPINCQGVRVKPLFEEGAQAAQVIGRVVEQQQVDLVVMATRGRSRSASILLGSVTEETLLATRVPLLAVKHFGARMGVLQALLDRRFRQGGDLRTD